MARRSLIDEARRHQHRRRQVIGAVVMTPMAIGGLIVGLNFGGAGSPGGEAATHSSHLQSSSQTPQAVGKNPPTAGSPSNVVVLSPSTGDVIAASTAAESAAALHAVQGAQQAALQAVQAQKAAESAQAAAAAAAQPGHH